MENLNSFVENIEIGEFRRFGRICLAPVDVKFARNKNYKTLSDLIKVAEVEVREISTSGSVNEVLVENKSKNYLIIFDTDIITGAKQNRVSALSLIIAPHSRVQFPVYCIERSRWSYSDGFNFSGSRFSVGPSIRSKKAEMIKKEHYQYVQSAVWDEVSDMSKKFKTASSTEDYVEILNKQNFMGINQINDFINNQETCGYVFSTPDYNLIEIFPSEKICRVKAIGMIQSLLADIDYSRDEFITPNKDELYDKLMTSRWIKRKPIGLEERWELLGDKQGQLISKNGQIAHGFQFL